MRREPFNKGFYQVLVGVKPIQNDSNPGTILGEIAHSRTPEIIQPYLRYILLC
jgi:hypothetical protein